MCLRLLTQRLRQAARFHFGECVAVLESHVLRFTHTLTHAHAHTTTIATGRKRSDACLWGLAERGSAYYIYNFIPGE